MMSKEEKMILRTILSKQAFERLSRVRLVKPLLSKQLESYLIQLYKQGKIKRIITDEQLRLILESISSGKRFRIIK